VFHLQIAPETQTTSNDTLFSLEDMQLIAREAGPRLAQIGFFNRIFMVRRKKTLSTEVVEERLRGWARIEPPEDERQGPSAIQIMAEHEDVQLEPWQKGTMTVGKQRLEVRQARSLACRAVLSDRRRCCLYCVWPKVRRLT
jgi:hypothetical protein